MTSERSIVAGTRVRRGASIVFQEVEGEAVLVNLERGTCFTLDPVGTRIWQLIGDGERAGHMTEVLTAEFDVAHDLAERDLFVLLSELVARELVVIDPDVP